MQRKGTYAQANDLLQEAIESIENKLKMINENQTHNEIAELTNNLVEVNKIINNNINLINKTSEAHKLITELNSKFKSLKELMPKINNEIL